MNPNDHKDAPPLQDGLVFRVCCGQACSPSSAALTEAIARYIADRGLGETIVLGEYACFGKCFMGPNIAVERWRQGRLSEKATLAVMLGHKHADLTFEHGVTVDDVPALIRYHMRKWREETG